MFLKAATNMWRLFISTSEERLPTGRQGRFYTASEPRTYIRKTKKIFPQYMV